jgi:hypothetical protein
LHENQSNITPTVIVGPLEHASTESSLSDMMYVDLDSSKSDHRFSEPSSSGGSNTHNKKFLPAADSQSSNDVELFNDKETALIGKSNRMSYQLYL